MVVWGWPFGDMGGHKPPTETAFGQAVSGHKAWCVIHCAGKHCAAIKGVKAPSCSQRRCDGNPERISHAQHWPQAVSSRGKEARRAACVWGRLLLPRAVSVAEIGGRATDGRGNSALRILVQPVLAVRCHSCILLYFRNLRLMLFRIIFGDKNRLVYLLIEPPG